MLDFDFLDARHGDCFMIRWGDGRAALIDGGPHRVYETGLKAHLTALPAGPTGPPRLDVVCLTHVDEDHVIGVLRLLIEVGRAVGSGLPAPVQIARLWFNSVEEVIETAAAELPGDVRPLIDSAPSQAVSASIAQGREIRNRAARLGLRGNSPFDAPLLCGAAATIGGLRVVVAAPDQTALEKLASTWRAAKKTNDPAIIAAAYSDGSIPNLSSIVLHLEYRGRTALLTGDARGDRILAGLAATGLLRDGEPYGVDLLKLPHHGSRDNVERDFFERVRARHYVVSADGVKHHHPSEETLEWLVESRASDDRFTVHLTNEIPFAIEKLRELQRGRAFDVVIRPTGARALRIAI